MSEIGKKYPKYISYVAGHWGRRKEWALCFRKHLLVRGNHTNNYSEAGIRILKELIFNRVKAYNHVQLFSFITECLELYYTRKLLSVAHNRIDRYISIKFQGIKSATISREHITQFDSEAGTYLVNSQTERGVKYLVNMDLGICSCSGGQDGSPCSHQAAIVKWLHIPSVNCVPVVSPESRQLLANIALGSGSIQAPQFYSSLHEKSLTVSTPSTKSPELHFDGSAWDLMRGLASSAETIPENDEVQKSGVNYESILADIEGVFADMKERMKNSLVVAQGTKVFLKRYKEIITRGKFANASLGSALYKFGWVFGGTVQSTQGGHLRRGRRIPVSAKAAGRRRATISKGKAKALSGRPKGVKRACYSPSKFTMQPRRVPKGKRLHSLNSNIVNGIQNGGKW